MVAISVGPFKRQDQIYNMVERKGDVQGFKYCIRLRIKLEESERLMHSLKRTMDTCRCRDDVSPTDVSPNKKTLDIASLVLFVYWTNHPGPMCPDSRGRIDIAPYCSVQKAGL